jgi:hypothetical protein
VNSVCRPPGPLRGLDEQVAKAELSVVGKTPVKRNRFIQLDGAVKTVDRELEAATRALEGYATNLATCRLNPATADLVIGTQAPGVILARERLLRRHSPGVAGHCRTWPDMLFSCTDSGWKWPGIARYLPLLAPRLAPRDSVTLANVRMIERSVEPFVMKLRTRHQLSSRGALAPHPAFEQAGTLGRGLSGDRRDRCSAQPRSWTCSRRAYGRPVVAPAGSRGSGCPGCGTGRTRPSTT